MQEIGNKLLVQSFYSDGFEHAVHSLRGIEISDSRFSIVQLAAGEPVAYEIWELHPGFNHEELVTQSKLLSLVLEQSSVVLSGYKNALLMPPAFSEKEELVRAGLVQAEPGFEWMTSRIRDFPVSVLFPFPVQSHALVRKYFPGAFITHRCMAVLKWMMNHDKLKEESIYFILDNSQLEIFIIKNAIPFMYNVFPAESTVDTAYYILAALEQAEINLLKRTVYFSAHPEDTSILRTLRSYIPAMVAIDLLNQSRNKGSAYLFPALVNAGLCE
ncbi:MAG: DUF3822 family protein [Bacteroidia bacterium]|nr:DUF3822 family protein [Bacteroidia bacterium]MCZ2277732.1 DUF3822 family protein [Bacteroidia bacterium]